MYSMLPLGNNFYWYPLWDKSPHPTEIAPGVWDNIIANFLLPTTIPEASFTFYAAITNHNTYNLIDSDSVTVALHKERPTPTITPTLTPTATPTLTPTPTPNPKMKTYFNKNPIHHGSDGWWRFTIYLENIGNIDITIDKFTMQFFDSEGNSEYGIEDYSNEFSEWFSLIDGLLPVGATAESSIGKPYFNTTYTVEFYFHGIDENNNEVEITSEKLGLIY